MLQADPEKKDALEQALLSLSVDLPGAPGQKLDSVVSSMSSESAVRVIAVRELFEKLKVDEMAEIVSARPRGIHLILILFSSPQSVLRYLLGFKIPAHPFLRHFIRVLVSCYPLS